MTGDWLATALNNLFCNSRVCICTCMFKAPEVWLVPLGVEFLLDQKLNKYFCSVDAFVYTLLKYIGMLFSALP